MPGPYDIYTNTHREETGRFNNIVESPVTMGAWLATDMVAIPWLTSTRGMQRTMLPTQWNRFKNIARAKYGGSIRNLALHGRPRDFIGATGRRGVIVGSGTHDMVLASGERGMLARDRLFHSGLRKSFGGAAASRIGVSRLLGGASKALFAYSMFQMGLGLINGINEVIENYEPPEPKTPFHRDLETGGGFVDTRSAQTQRQRAIQAIHNTQLSTRAALGNEASILHAQHR